MVAERTIRGSPNFKINPLGTMNVFTKFHSNSQDISVKTIRVPWYADRDQVQSSYTHFLPVSTILSLIKARLDEGNIFNISTIIYRLS